MPPIHKLLLAALLALPCTSAFSNVTLGGTRLVINAQDPASTISVNNQGDTPLLIQSWVSGQDKRDKAPFVVTPPLFRLESSQENTLRVLTLPNTLPQDQESLFWLNVKEVPPLSDADQGKNILRIAINNRIKVFYRPNDLPGSADNAPQQLQWRLLRQPDGKWALQAHNPSPYHITFASVKFDGVALKTLGMVAPGADLGFAPVSASHARHTVAFTTINDYGGSSKPISVNVSDSLAQ